MSRGFVLYWCEKFANIEMGSVLRSSLDEWHIILLKKRFMRNELDFERVMFEFELKSHRLCLTLIWSEQNGQ